MAEFASKGVAGAGLGLGIAGTSLALLNGGLGNIFGTNTANNVVADEVATTIPFVAGAMANGFGRNTTAQECFENTYVSQHELDMQNDCSQKDATIAKLESEKYTDSVGLEVYKYFDEQLKTLNQKLCDSNKDQAVINAQVESGLNVQNSQIASLSNTLASITKTVIPNASVCPGWGNVSVNPTSGSTVVGYDCNIY
jgi:PPE-repeat protein